MPSLENTIVNRSYKCTNENCKCIIAYEEKATAKWRVKCPFCKQNSLLLEYGEMALTVLFDVKKPKTIGSLAEKNTLSKIKNGDIEEKKKKTPFWRKNKKVNYSILKSPERYIETGTS